MPSRSRRTRHRQLRDGAPGRIRTCDTRLRKRSCGVCIVGDVQFRRRRDGRDWLHGAAIWHQFAPRMAPRHVIRPRAPGLWRWPRSRCRSAGRRLAVGRVRGDPPRTCDVVAAACAGHRLAQEGADRRTISRDAPNEPSGSSNCSMRPSPTPGAARTAAQRTTARPARRSRRRSPGSGRAGAGAGVARARPPPPATTGRRGGDEARCGRRGSSAGRHLLPPGLPEARSPGLLTVAAGAAPAGCHRSRAAAGAGPIPHRGPQRRSIAPSRS